MTGVVLADIPPPEKTEPRDACTYASWGLGLVMVALAIRFLRRPRRA